MHTVTLVVNGKPTVFDAPRGGTLVHHTHFGSTYPRIHAALKRAGGGAG